VRKITQEVTGKHGNYNGRISASAGERGQTPEDKAEKEKAVMEDGAENIPIREIF